MNKVVNPTIGTDPEFFVVDSHDRPISIIDFVPGNKKEPYDMGDGICVQPDGVMVEGTCPPVTTKKDFLRNIQFMREKFNMIAKSVNPEFKIVERSSGHYDPMFLDDYRVRTFGCDPSYCIYTKSVSHRPSAESVGTLRTAGFHIHIGTEALLTNTEIEFLIFCMDKFCGVPSIIMDDDQERRQLYGNAGDFRVKTIGDKITVVEYRSLGGAMIAYDDFVYDATMKAIEYYNENIENFAENPESFETDFVTVKNIIDKQDKNAANIYINNLTSRWEQEQLLQLHNLF